MGGCEDSIIAFETIRLRPWSRDPLALPEKEFDSGRSEKNQLVPPNTACAHLTLAGEFTE